MKRVDRKQKAVQIYSQINSIRKITKNHYVVDSQNSDKQYRVKKFPDVDVWTCECPDFHYRLRTQDDKHCKHTQSCIILKDNVITQNGIERAEQPQIYSKCKFTTIIKIGFRSIKNGTKRQRYQCKQCRHKFILGENGFSKMTSDPKVISESLNLVMSGVFYRNISRHIYSHIKSR